MARTRFDICLDQVLQFEGGYADHPSDPGGATNMGITRKTLARWRAVTPWWGLAKSEVQNLDRAEAAKIYKGSYWDRSNAGRLPPGLDLALFDFAVNSGPDRAIKTLQGQLNVVADGQVGPLTLGAIKTEIALRGAAGLIDALCNRRLDFLTRLATFAVFGKGWTARVAAIRKAALAAAGAQSSTTVQSPTWSDTMAILSGYKTYIVAAFMLIAGLAQMLGIDLPTLDSSSAGHLIMEALAVIFLRKGLKSDIGNA
ncbi:lysozyme family protein [Devosia sp. UYZn731]|uniref:glycoside hydrolase family 108 protein n=1 Tax=Devosia sp. UYZn731 TaxID=3156345 RepID=UPI003393976D